MFLKGECCVISEMISFPYVSLITIYANPEKTVETGVWPYFWRSCALQFNSSFCVLGFMKSSRTKKIFFKNLTDPLF